MKIRSKITFNIFTLVALLASLLGSAVFVPSVQASQDNSLTFAGGTSLYVATSGSDSNDCLTISTPCQTINAAIGKAAVVGDTIYVATGIYTGSGTDVVLINKNVTLSGGWNASFAAQDSRSTIDGQNVRRGITILQINKDVVVTVDYFTIQNGFGEGQTTYSPGGGVSNYGTLTLSNSIITNNVSEYTTGGGIFNSGTLTLSNSTVNNNIARNAGGGIYNVGPLLIINNSVTYFIMHLLIANTNVVVKLV